MERKVKIDGERGGFIDAKAFALFVFFVVSTFDESLGLVVLLVALAAATLLLDHRFRLCCLLFVLLLVASLSLSLSLSTSVFVLVEEVISLDFLSVDNDRPVFLDFLLFLVGILLGVLSMY